MDYNEFAEKIKAKYPDYADMDNRTLAQKMVAKFPEYSDVTFDQPYQPSMLESAAEGISSAMAPIGNAAARVPMPQPIESTQDFALPERTGNTFTDALKRAAYPASMAARTAQTVVNAPQAVGEGVAELGGRAGFPKTAAVAGMAIANAPAMIPINLGAKVSTALKPFKGKPGIAARIKQMRTGVEASAFEQLRRDPTAFFSRTSRADAGAAIGEAKQASGISTGVTDNIASLTPENVARARNLQSVSNKAQDDVIAKIEQGATVEPNEVSLALEGINKRLARIERTEGHGSPSFQQWSAIKSHFQNLLEEVAPDVRQANKEFSRVALRDKFMEPLPVNQAGTMSKIGSFGFTPLAATGGAVVGGPVGAIVGGVAAQAVRSPFLAGLGTATRGLIDKMIDPALSRTGSEIIKRPLLLEYLRRRNDRGSK